MINILKQGKMDNFIHNLIRIHPLSFTHLKCKSLSDETETGGD